MTTSKTGLFHTILFASSMLFALAAATGCSASVDGAGEEAATESQDSLDQEHLETKKIVFDPSVAADLDVKPGAGNGYGNTTVGGAGENHEKNKKHNIE